MRYSEPDYNWPYSNFCFQNPMLTWRLCYKKPQLCYKASLASSHAPFRWSPILLTWPPASSARTHRTKGSAPLSPFLFSSTASPRRCLETQGRKQGPASFAIRSRSLLSMHVQPAYTGNGKAPGIIVCPAREASNGRVAGGWASFQAQPCFFVLHSTHVVGGTIASHVHLLNVSMYKSIGNGGYGGKPLNICNHVLFSLRWKAVFFFSLDSLVLVQGLYCDHLCLHVL